MFLPVASELPWLARSSELEQPFCEKMILGGYPLALRTEMENWGCEAKSGLSSRARGEKKAMWLKRTVAGQAQYSKQRKQHTVLNVWF